MTIAVIAPHPDDETLGCGGVLRLHALRGDRVVAMFLTSGEHALKHLPRAQAWDIRESEARAAAQVLGIAATEFLRRPDWFLSQYVEDAASALRPLLRREAPDVVLVPHERDAHPDHYVSQEIYRRAVEPLPGFRPAVLAYEVWTPLTRYNHLINIGEVLRDKLRAARCYRSQLEMFRYDHAVRGLNRYRGALHTQWRYAEALDNLTAASDAICTGFIDRGAT